jgi:PIN domain nuclease of toxin-antitoxin system
MSKAAATAYLNPENESYLSASSAWEIAIKYALGRLPMPGKPEIYIPQIRERGGIGTLPLDEESALCAARLPKFHADPFDRILVAQAIVHGMVILTPDDAIARYGVRVLW